jgi:hypothetical protein
MAGPYDYSINIPQPPAQNFLQSLTGIMQLRQMQDQSAIQQQQAAIQQQNAAFQQQMQPLQLEAERARIGQIGQATATSAEALRQGKLTFEQAQQDRIRQMEQQAVAQAQQRELVGKFTSLPSNAPMSEIVPIANQLLLLPGGDKVAKQAMENFDALQQEFQKASKTALVTATTQLQAGDIEGAKKTYSTFEQAVRNSGGTNPQLVQLADGIKAQNMLLDLPDGQGVNSAKLAAVQMLSIVDPKAADTILQGEKVVVPAKEKQVDEEKRALDLEKERLQIQEIRQKLDQAREEKVKVFASTNKFAKELSDASATNQQSADIAKGILEKIDSGEVQIPSTAKGAAWQYVRDRIPLLGNDVTMLRKEYQKLANSEVIKSLPPGSASDADRRFAQEGVMSKDANPKQFRKGVEAMARLSEYASRYNEAKLAWVSQNAGSAGSALKEFSVFGAPIKKGSAFNAWWNKEGNKLDQNFMPDQAGGIPATGGAPSDVMNALKRAGIVQ